MNGKNFVFTDIVLRNSRRDRMLSKFACRNRRARRLNPEREKIPDRENIRPPYFHDTDKIMHSLAYTRYIDKTQVFFLFENDHITHRALHVQLVSKIGRVIGRALNLNEDLIEAIALGHDIGHAPYGHDGEGILHKICKESGIGCFCHSAQSVRWLMELELGGQGLNLTLQVLDGILAHNGEILSRIYEPSSPKKWDEFFEEYESCFKTEGYYKKILPMTLEGCVVRISDIIAYIGRDIEDAINIKLIKRKDIPIPIAKTLGRTNDQIINTLVIDIIKNSHHKPRLVFSDDVFKALHDLMKFNGVNIYQNPRIKTEIAKIEHMFHRLFDKFRKEIKENNLNSSIFNIFLNNMNEGYKSKVSNERKVMDYLAGMTDAFLKTQFTEAFVPQPYGYQLESMDLKSSV
jgi:dGTPase